MSPPAAAVEFARHGERQIVVGSGCVVVCERWRVVPPEMVLACGTLLGTLIITRAEGTHL